MKSLGPLALVCILASAACDPVADGDLAIGLRLDAIYPRFLPTSGGVEVTVEGVNLADGVELSIAGAPVPNAVRLDAHHLVFISPPLGVGRFEVVAENPNHDRARIEGHGFADQIELEPASLISDAQLDELLVGDLDGDGDDDLVGTAGSRIQTLINHGHADLTPAPGGGAPVEDDEYLRLAADLDGDGRAEVVTSRAVYRTADDGALGARIEFGPVDHHYWATAARGDFDGDGRSELAVFRPADGVQPPLLSLYHLDGAALELVGERTDVDIDDADEHPQNMFAPAVRDLDGDGDDDLAYVGEDQRVHVIFGPALDPAVGFEHPLPPVTLDWWVVGIDDVDDDGELDLVVDAVHGAQETHVLRGTGSSFAAPEPRGRPCPTSALEDILLVGRLRTSDREPQPSVRAARCSDGTLRVQVDRHDEDGTPPLYVDTYLDGGSGIGRFDDDEIPDLVYRTPGGIAARFGGEDAYFRPRRAIRITEDAIHDITSTTVAVGRLGGGAAVVAAAPGGLAVFATGERPTEIARGSLEPGSVVGVTLTCDLDGDGEDEMVVATSSSGVLPSDHALHAFALRGDALEEIGSLPAVEDGGHAWEDQEFGLVQSGRMGGEVGILWLQLEDGERRRVTAARFWSGQPLRARPVALETEVHLGERLVGGDADGDGDLDLVRVGDRGRTSLFISSGLGFEERPISIAERTAGAIFTARGDLWLLASEATSVLAQVADGKVIRRAGDPSSWLSSPLLSSGDVDGDGREDLVLSTSHTFRVFLGRDDGGLARVPSFPADASGGRSYDSGIEWDSLALVDWNRDGVDDLVGGASGYPGRLLHWKNASR